MAAAMHQLFYGGKIEFIHRTIIIIWTQLNSNPYTIESASASSVFIKKERALCRTGGLHNQETSPCTLVSLLVMARISLDT